ncbi:hypothetical protein [Drosophila suzukii associated hytrosavirus 1]|nr:hypothetical protein [Drosophila suzukii associated hytrosavirus 1]
MEKFNENISSLFLPTVNILQEKSLDKKLNFEVDFQNNDLYVLQELTRCSALLNYIHHNGKTVFADRNAKVNSVFDTFLQIPDPLSVFIDNFEQFFGMYIHSKYGKNNFQIFMKECEKSPVAYPISVFEDGLCIFMQYNKCELRTYIYNIMTMFYYYTGQNFYEMIRPSGHIPRPNHFDEFNDAQMDKDESEEFSKAKTRSTIVKRKLAQSREEKLCQLNKRNYNVNKPFMRRQTQFDSLSTNAHFEKCILTSNFRGDDHRFPEVLVGSLQRPIVAIENLGTPENNVLPNIQCKDSGMTEDGKIYQLSEHLNRSRNFEVDTLYEDATLPNDRERQQQNRKAYVQTNFSKVWSCENRRQLVALSIVYSVMNVCVQKITYSLMEASNVKQDDGSVGVRCEKIFKCVQNPNSIETDYMEKADDETDEVKYNSSAAKIAQKFRRDIKSKKPTIQVSFNSAPVRRVHTNVYNPNNNIAVSGLENLKFST